MFDGAQFGEDIVKEVRSFVERATSPLLSELETLRRRVSYLESRPAAEAIKGLDGSDGRDGADVSEEQIALAVERHLAANPPLPGKDGLDGKASDPAQVAELIVVDEAVVASVVARYLAAHPPASGLDGRDGVDGVDGAPGEKGADGDSGKDGVDGRDGKDGVGLAGALTDRQGNLVITLTDGTMRELGVVVGKDGEPGRPGLDGLGFDDLDVTRPDERTVVISFTKGEITRSFELGLRHPIYRGVFKEGEAYEPGDMVTWAGGIHHCNEPTADKPGEGMKAWTLAVKRGRDGKDAVK